MPGCGLVRALGLGRTLVSVLDVGVGDKRAALGFVGAGAKPSDMWHRIERSLAAVSAVIVAIRFSVGPQVSAGLVVGVALAPVWVHAVRGRRGAGWLFGTGLAALGSGVLLTAISSADHAVDEKLFVSILVWMLGLLLSVGVVCWTATLWGAAGAARWYAVGLLINAAMEYRADHTDNPMKYLFGIPLAVAVLALLANRNWLQVPVLLALAGLFAVSDTRIYFATVLLVAVLILWELRPATGRRMSAAFTVLLLAAVGAAVYFLGTTLLVDGYLGSNAQVRSVQQIRTAGSLLLGGRPEIAATWALVRYRPWGFGPGVQVTSLDLNAAKAGLEQINYQPNNGYVEKFMFGDGIEVHSTTGDLFVHFGLVGLMFAGIVLIVTLVALARTLNRREASGLTLFLAVFALWNLFFSPLYSSIPTLALWLGLLLGTDALGRRRPPFGDHLRNTSVRTGRAPVVSASPSERAVRPDSASPVSNALVNAPRSNSGRVPATARSLASAKPS